jgi:MFS family permease
MPYLPTRRAVAVFTVLASAYLLSALVRGVTGTLAPVLTQDFGLSAAQLGLLAGGYFLGFACMQLPLGQWLDRYGPQKVQLWLLSLAVLGCLAFALADGFATLLLARVLSGIGLCACLMAPLTGYRRWYAPEQQMRANSWMLMVGAFGMVASTLPVQWLMPLWGWRGIFVLLGVLVAVSMLAIAWQSPPWQTETAAAPVSEGVLASYHEVWRHPYFRKLAPLGFFNYGGMVAMQTLWAGPWMVKVAGYSALQAATGLFWLNVAMLLAYWLWGWANPWLARQGHTADRLIRWGMPLNFVLFATLLVAGSAISTGATVLFSLVCVSCTVAALAQPAVGMAFPAALAGRALSAYNLVIFSGVFAVQWGIGLLLDGFKALGLAEVVAYQAAFGVYGLACLGAYLYFLRAKAP